MQKLGLHLPYNGVSFGNLGILISKTLFERERNGKSDLDISIFTIGQADLSAWKEDKDFNNWLNTKSQKAFESWDRNTPIFKLWHLNGSLESFSNKQTLLSFYELDRPTKFETCIARNNNLCFTSQYTCDVFKTYGVNAHYLPPVFDSYNFSRIDKKFHVDGRIVFNLVGKLEKRKHHEKVIKAWIKKYGNNNKYVLQCAIYNPFLVQQTPQGVQDLNNHFLSQIVGGNKPFNVIFYPTMKENSVYNEFLNSANIVIGMSGGEGIGLPEMHSVGIGKHAIILNAHGYKGWANEQNSTLVNPSGKIDATDGVFFHQNAPFNQGNIFDWNEDDFINACEIAIKKVESDSLNKEGLKIQEDFSKEKFVDNILKYAL